MRDGFFSRRTIRANDLGSASGTLEVDREKEIFTLLEDYFFSTSSISLYFDSSYKMLILSRDSLT